MKFLATLIIFSTANAFAITNDNNQIKICSNLMAARSVSDLETKSYYARGYDNVTSIYMRVALNHVLSHLEAAKSTQKLEIDPLIKSVTESVQYEIRDSYNYDNYRVSTASRVFSKLSNDVRALEETNFCL
jgi:hypothetical protein